VSRDPGLYVKDTVAACERVIAYAGDRSRAELFADTQARDAILWNLLVLGEAAKSVPEDVRAAYPVVEWRKISGFRDVLAHGYFGIDEDIVWDVIANKLAPLREALRAPA
jgi:uncharacterized protein with HEPN domain